jgi:hypothetical protein
MSLTIKVERLKIRSSDATLFADSLASMLAGSPNKDKKSTRVGINFILVDSLIPILLKEVRK